MCGYQTHHSKKKFRARKLKNRLENGCLEIDHFHSLYVPDYFYTTIALKKRVQNYIVL